jgi:UDP-N-acetylglucosamine 4,6-dehydratase
VADDLPVFPYRTILITGGTGTFGHAMVRHLVSLNTEMTIRIMSRDEYKQKNMAWLFHDPRLRFFIGDVRDLPRLHLAVSGVDLVIHAAALKHIDKGEYDGDEFHKTNVIGTLNVLKACQMGGVQQAIFISSDKACYPINLYGLSKGIAEHLWIQGNHYAPHGTRLAAVRYANVADSRGSVIELWHNALAAGQPFPLTDERMTRFWMSIQEAVRLVLWTAAHGLRGGVVVPHLPAFALVDLARAMLPPARETWHIVGQRPGEKLAEMLLTAEEQERAYWYAASEHVPVYYIIPPIMQEWGPAGERLMWEMAPPDLVHGGGVDVTRKGPYRSDVWPWRLSVEDIRQRLQGLPSATPP